MKGSGGNCCALQVIDACRVEELVILLELNLDQEFGLHAVMDLVVPINHSCIGKFGFCHCDLKVWLIRL